MQESAGDQRKGRSKVIKHHDRTDSVAVKQKIKKGHFLFLHFHFETKVYFHFQINSVSYLFTKLSNTEDFTQDGSHESLVLKAAE